MAKVQAAWFLFGRAVWPTFDTYCDICISLYCILDANAWAWGLAMMAPLLCHLASAISSYVRMRKENMLEKNDLTWIAIPFFIWPQVNKVSFVRRIFFDIFLSVPGASRQNSKGNVGRG